MDDCFRAFLCARTRLDIDFSDIASNQEYVYGTYRSTREFGSYNSQMCPTCEELHTGRQGLFLSFLSNFLGEACSEMKKRQNTHFVVLRSAQIYFNGREAPPRSLLAVKVKFRRPRSKPWNFMGQLAKVRNAAVARRGMKEGALTI